MNNLNRFGGEQFNGDGNIDIPIDGDARNDGEKVGDAVDGPNGIDYPIYPGKTVVTGEDSLNDMPSAPKGDLSVDAILAEYGPSQKSTRGKEELSDVDQILAEYGPSGEKVDEKEVDRILNDYGQDMGRAAKTADRLSRERTVVGREVASQEQSRTEDRPQQSSVETPESTTMTVEVNGEYRADVISKPSFFEKIRGIWRKKGGEAGARKANAKSAGGVSKLKKAVNALGLGAMLVTSMSGIFGGIANNKVEAVTAKDTLTQEEMDILDQLSVGKNNVQPGGSTTFESWAQEKGIKVNVGDVDLGQYDQLEQQKYEASTKIGGETVKVAFEKHEGGYKPEADVHKKGEANIAHEAIYDTKETDENKIARQIAENFPKAVTSNPEALAYYSIAYDLVGGSGNYYKPTMQGVNELADVLRNGDADAYDAVANNFTEFWAESLNGGEVKIENFAPGQEYISNFLMDAPESDGFKVRTGNNYDMDYDQSVIKDGVIHTIDVVDKNGNSINNNEKTKKLFKELMGLDQDEDVTISNSGECIQHNAKTPGEPDSGSEGTGEEDTGDEGTGDESTGDESTGEEGTGNEGTGEEGTGNEGTGEEGTGSEGTGEEGTGSEGTGDESTGSEGTGSEGTGSEGTGEEGTGSEGTGEEGTGSEGTGEEGTGVEGTGSEGTGIEGTGEEGTGFEGTGEEGTGVELESKTENTNAGEQDKWGSTPEQDSTVVKTEENDTTNHLPGEQVPSDLQTDTEKENGWVGGAGAILDNQGVAPSQNPNRPGQTVVVEGDKDDLTPEQVEDLLNRDQDGVATTFDPTQSNQEGIGTAQEAENQAVVTDEEKAELAGAGDAANVAPGSSTENVTNEDWNTPLTDQELADLFGF